MSMVQELLPDPVVMWPEFDTTDIDTIGFRTRDAVDIAAALWPHNPDHPDSQPVQWEIPGRDHPADCGCAQCEHAPAGSNQGRVLALPGADRYPNPTPRRGNTIDGDVFPDRDKAERVYDHLARTEGHAVAAAWWRNTGQAWADRTATPLPFDHENRGRIGVEIDMELRSRRTAALVIAPGVVTVKWSSAAKVESDDDVLDHVDDCPCDDCMVFRAAIGDQDDDNEDGGGPVADRVVKGFSARSKGRMMRYVASVDWAGLRQPDERMVGITLTYPADWRKAAPTPEAVIAHLSKFCKKFERATGHPMRCVWVREFQHRGAPHFHLCALAPTHARGDDFRHWLSRAWWEAVGSGDPDHLAAGTRIDFKTSVGMAIDPKRAAAYFAGYTSKDKAYQHEAPEGWTNENGSVGAYWGRRGLRLATAEVPLNAGDVVEIKRLMRRLIRSQKRTVTTRVGREFVTEVVHHQGDTHTVERPDGSTDTLSPAQVDVIERKPTRFRNVTRRWRLRSLTPNGPAADGERGFTMFTNDGPLLAAQLARALHPTDEPWPKGERRPLP